MDFYGALDALFAYALPGAVQEQPVAVRSGRTASLEDLVRARVRCLSDILASIERDIRSRNQLSYLVLAHIDTYYCYLKSKLLDLYRWPVGRDRVIEQRRFGIEKLLEALHTEKRGELTARWQDIARLNSEFRTWLKQYCDLTQRAGMLIRQPESNPETEPH
jgi:hypothetical protein